ncbi:hypothetical protein RRG08_021561 [Elysia crispata]|uniref:Uncharacterized protein n=1 Tax=Elysia crispata TaxID=231223 RepID=A0AAE0XDN9_9GAST|nr:hypothetical protein RRG08_021561 [Elysia crispata]
MIEPSFVTPHPQVLQLFTETTAQQQIIIHKSIVTVAAKFCCRERLFVHSFWSLSLAQIQFSGGDVAYRYRRGEERRGRNTAEKESTRVWNNMFNHAQVQTTDKRSIRGTECDFQVT